MLSPLSRFSVFDTPLFPEIHWGTFVGRPNRFLVECALEGRIIQAHLPNPGRLWELLIPGRAIGLVGNSGPVERKTAFTAVAVVREGRPVLLHTHAANDIVQVLLARDMIRGLEGADIIRREVAMGNSRFDFLLQKGRQKIILEVKSCTLFGRHTAMFPDAVTERGRRHLLELAKLSKEGFTCGVVFLVHCAHARFFMPDYHTDLEFSQTFYRLRDRLMIRAVSVPWNHDLRIAGDVREMDIPWKTLKREAHDRGNYILICRFPKDTRIEISADRHLQLRRGWYLHAGSVREEMSRRIRSLTGKGRRARSGLDKIIRNTEGCLALPIRSRQDLLPEITGAMERISGWSVNLPGTAGCGEGLRLFGMAENPIHCETFMDVLQYFRMDRLRLASC